jgi:hypothetical protein
MANLTLPFAGSFETNGTVFEITQPTQGGSAIAGSSFGVNSQDGTSGIGVVGQSDSGGTGVLGTSDSGPGVHGNSRSGSGVVGVSNNGVGVWAESTGNGAGLFAKATGGPAGQFEGNVKVTGQMQAGSMHIGVFGGIIDGALSVRRLSCDDDFLCFGDIKVASGKDVILADCAEEFDVRQELSIEPGTVMVIAEEGLVEPSCRAYDKRVAGVISGAGNCKPAIVLDKQQSHGHRVPVALLGKVYCKVDAQYASIELGDLLTTSPTSGHAMKACDAIKGFGAIIGKALRSQKSGLGMIPILVALQ